MAATVRNQEIERGRYMLAHAYCANSNSDCCSAAAASNWMEALSFISSIEMERASLPQKANWSAAQRTLEKMSRVMKDPPEALSLQDIKLAQIQVDLCQVKADAKFYSNSAYAIYGVFGCCLIAIPIQMKCGDLEIEVQVKQNKKDIVALEKKVKSKDKAAGKEEAAEKTEGADGKEEAAEQTQKTEGADGKEEAAEQTEKTEDADGKEGIMARIRRWCKWF